MGRYLFTLWLMIGCSVGVSAENLLNVYVKVDRTGEYEVLLNVRLDSAREPPVFRELTLQQEDIDTQAPGSFDYFYEGHYTVGESVVIADVLSITGYSPTLYGFYVANHLKDIDGGEVCVSLPPNAKVIQHNAMDLPKTLSDVCHRFSFDWHAPGYLVFDLATE